MNEQIIQEPINWFEELYAKNTTSFENIPWAKQKPNEALVLYLNNITVTKNTKALVIGCGIGDDAFLLEQKGFNVTAIDISKSALEIAKKRFPNSSINFEQQNIFDMPKSFNNEYEFIFEAYTIQSLPRDSRVNIIESIVSMLARKSQLLVVAHANEYSEITTNPPWPLNRTDFNTFLNLDLTQVLFKLYDDKSGISSKKYKAIYTKV